MRDLSFTYYKQTLPHCTTRVARFIFSKKGQKQPIKLLKEAQQTIKKGQKRAKPFTRQSQIH